MTPIEKHAVNLWDAAYATEAIGNDEDARQAWIAVSVALASVVDYLRHARTSKGEGVTAELLRRVALSHAGCI